jgi:DNA-directed RNA polymerase subunit alpha
MTKFTYETCDLEEFTKVINFLKTLKNESIEKVSYSKDLDMPIAEFCDLLRPDICVRVANCLRAAGIEYVGDLCKSSYLDLTLVPNIGKKSIDAIIATLESKGLNLGMILPEYEAFTSLSEYWNMNNPTLWTGCA